MKFSSLYVAVAIPMVTFDADEAPDTRHYVCGVFPDGTFVIHGQPGVTPVNPTLVLRDGSSAWTWLQVAEEQGDAWCALVTPHEWAGESTAAGIDATHFPLLAPPIIDGAGLLP